MKKRRMILGALLLLSWGIVYVVKRQRPISPSNPIQVKENPLAPVCAPPRIEKKQTACECPVVTEVTCPDDADLQEQERLPKERSLPLHQWDVDEQTTDMEKLSSKYAHECFSLQPEVHRASSCQKLVDLQKKLCDRGDQEYCLRFGLLLWHGSSEIPADQAGAVEVWKKMCSVATEDAANAEACYHLGMLRRGEDEFGKMNGSKIQMWQDPTEALSLFEVGCNAGHGNACYELARLYEKGAGGPEKNKQISILMDRACRSDGAERACHWMGAQLAQKVISQSN